MRRRGCVSRDPAPDRSARRRSTICITRSRTSALLPIPFFRLRFTDFTLLRAIPTLEPETAWTYDAGFELHNDEASFKATYFRANVTNLIQTINTFITNTGTITDPDVEASQTINVGTARRQGLEIQIDHRLNAYFKDGWNYTYLENVGIPVGYTNFVDLAYSPLDHQGQRGFVKPSARRLTLDWTNTLRYESSRFLRQHAEHREITSIPGNGALGYEVSVRDGKHLEPYIQVNDITGRAGMKSRTVILLPGRTFIGGVQCHFE